MAKLAFGLLVQLLSGRGVGVNSSSLKTSLLLMLFLSTLDLEKGLTVTTCENVLHNELVHKLTESKSRSGGAARRTLDKTLPTLMNSLMRHFRSGFTHFPCHKTSLLQSFFFMFDLSCSACCTSAFFFLYKKNVSSSSISLLLALGLGQSFSAALSFQDGHLLFFIQPT